MRYELLNNETSRRKVVSCVTPCRIQLVEPKSYTTCRIQLVCHGHYGLILYSLICITVLYPLVL